MPHAARCTSDGSGPCEYNEYPRCVVRCNTLHTGRPSQEAVTLTHGLGGIVAHCRATGRKRPGVSTPSTHAGMHPCCIRPEHSAVVRRTQHVACCSAGTPPAACRKRALAGHACGTPRVARCNGRLQRRAACPSVAKRSGAPSAPRRCRTLRAACRSPRAPASFSLGWHGCAHGVVRDALRAFRWYGPAPY